MQNTLNIKSKKKAKAVSQLLCSFAAEFARSTIFWNGSFTLKPTSSIQVSQMHFNFWQSFEGKDNLYKTGLSGQVSLGTLIALKKLSVMVLMKPLNSLLG